MPSNPGDKETKINVSFTNGTTSADDFNHTTVQLTFSAGRRTAQSSLFPYTTLFRSEADETFTANLALDTPLTGGRLSNTSDTATGTILNDDTATYTKIGRAHA